MGRHHGSIRGSKRHGIADRPAIEMFPLGLSLGHNPQLTQPSWRARRRLNLFAAVVASIALGATACDQPVDNSSSLCRKPNDDLHMAAAKGDLSGVQALVDRGAQVDRPDELGWTALHWAVAGGQIKVAKSLLDRAADPNAPDHVGMTPLHWAAAQGRAELVAPLLSRGARLDSRNIYGMTPLHEAASPQVCRALRRSGAELEATDDRGRTPLYVARNEGVARFLLEEGADIRVRAHSGRTALEVAVLNQAEAAGLTFYVERAAIRLRRDRTRFAIEARNVSICEIRDLALVVQSPAAWALVRPRKVARLAPGQMQNIAIDLQRRPAVAEGEHPIDIQVALKRTRVGRLELVVDTRRAELPTDRGMIPLGKGVLRPAGIPGVYYLPFLAIPLIVLAYWFWLGFRRRRRR